MNSLYYQKRLSRNIGDKFFTSLSVICALIAILPLIFLVTYILIKGGSQITPELFTLEPNPPGDDLDAGGIMAGVLLALGRAMGETMAVTMIIGNSNAFSWSLLSPGYTISSMLANQFGEADGSQVSSLFYAAFVLMILSLVVNIFAQWLVKKFSLKY